jgi:hypothetical protein
MRFGADHTRAHPTPSARGTWPGADPETEASAACRPSLLRGAGCHRQCRTSRGARSRLDTALHYRLPYRSPSRSRLPAPPVPVQACDSLAGYGPAPLFSSTVRPESPLRRALARAELLRNGREAVPSPLCRARPACAPSSAPRRVAALSQAAMERPSAAVGPAGREAGPTPRPARRHPEGCGRPSLATRMPCGDGGCGPGRAGAWPHAHPNPEATGLERQGGSRRAPPENAATCWRRVRFAAKHGIHTRPSTTRRPAGRGLLFAVCARRSRCRPWTALRQVLRDADNQNRLPRRRAAIRAAGGRADRGRCS